MAKRGEVVIDAISEKGMNIKIDDRYFITSDAFNYILNRKTKPRDCGKERIITEGYYSSIEDLLNALIEKRLKESEIKTLTEFKKQIKRIREDIKSYCEVINSYVKDN